MSFSEFVDAPDLKPEIDAPEATISDARHVSDIRTSGYWTADARLRILYNEDLLFQLDHSLVFDAAV